MAQPEILYCTQCGHPGTRGNPYCPNCGMPRQLTPQKRTGHVAFLLNELHLSPMTEVVTAQQRARLETHYEDELRGYIAPQQVRRAAAVAPAGAVAAVAATPAAPWSGEARRTAPPPPPRPPAPPREPYDWSWLAEQQANLFLFAGAFLTVVAALIYVGYSGQAVDGSLKMTLLVVYTLAFLGAGWFCLGNPKVEIAGRVFFGVGALLVPMNFAAARSILSGEDVSAETMWLAGSLTTAAFYAAVAWLGLGRMYALGAVASLISGSIAAAVATDMPPEWAPLLFIGVAFAMTLTAHTGIERIRERIGAIFDPLGQAFGAGALGLALIMALIVAGESDAEEAFFIDASTRWFLPITITAFALGAGVLAWLRKQEYLGAVALGAVAGAGVSVAYALELPAEGWVIVIAAVAAYFGLMLLVVEDGFVAKLLPPKVDEYTLGYGVTLTAIAAAIALFVLQAAYGEDPATYEVRTRWFLAMSAALGLGFYAMVAASKRGRTEGTSIVVSIGLMPTLAGTWIATIYGFGWPAEAYAIGIAAMAPALGLALVAAQDKRLARMLPKHLDDAAYITAIGATAVSAAITLVVLLEAHSEVDPYVISNRWILLGVAPLSAVFYTLDAQKLLRRAGVPGFALASAGVCASVVYAIDTSAEYYAFTPIVPAIALIAAVRWTPARFTSHLHVEWREDIVVLGRIGVAAGLLVALMATAAGADTDTVWQPQSHIFLPAAFLAAAAFLAIDASREKRVETSLAFVAALGAAAVTVPYAFHAEAAYYGVAFAVTGLLFAASGRLWTPSWLDGRARDGLAVLAVAASTLPFEGAYADVPGIGAGVHFAAAFFFGIAAIGDRSGRTFGMALDKDNELKVRVSAGWLYTAALCAGIAYIFTLRSVAGEEQAQGEALAVPMLFGAIALMAAGVASKFWRPEFRLHFYLMSLIAALVSIATSGDPGTLALVLTVYVAAYPLIAALEDMPAIAAPSVAFGFIAVAAWRAHLDESFAVLPIAYSLAGAAAYCSAFALKDRLPRWSMALRATGAAYALVAPAAGFGVLTGRVEGGATDSDEFARTALYQCSTLAVAAVGVLALVESMIARRRWVIVPASAVLTVALLLQIGRFEPENPQVYTAVVGSYLVLLAIVGLSRMKLIPELGEFAVYVEALGAATVMLPSFVQSFDAGWRYQWILLIEAAMFLTAGIGLRRRGILSAGVLFMVLVAGRTLFDALNAMPNWIVVALCGIGLLGIGMGILLGRERWDKWQRTVVSWWENAGDGALAG